MIEIIPAMDIIDGKCVRLLHGDFSRKTLYDVDPVEMAKRFEAAGLTRLHVVDLDGAGVGRPANLHILERVAGATSLSIDHGGGIKTEQDIQAVFDAGAAMANIGSLSVTEPERFTKWLGEFGPDRFLLGADAKNGMIAINGWQTVTDISVLDHLAKFSAVGLNAAFVTDIARDGAMNGPAIDLYREILAAFPALNLIASGGVSSVADLDTLDSIGCCGAIVGKALYEGTIALEELAKYVG